LPQREERDIDGRDRKLVIVHVPIPYSKCGGCPYVAKAIVIFSC
jgi:hypothetical protein